VTTCISQPAVTISSTMRVITSPVGAVSGAKCGHSTTILCGFGNEMFDEDRSEDDIATTARLSYTPAEVLPLKWQ
jgi:hypothetical protein